MMIFWFSWLEYPVCHSGFLKVNLDPAILPFM